MCFEHGLSGIFSKMSSADLGKSEITVEDWKKVVDEVHKYNPIIQLFGGEPLLYKGFDELIWYIKKRRLRCHIVTNGTLLNEKAPILVENQVDEIWVSMDGPKDIHDEIRGIKGTYDRVIEGIETLIQVKKSKGFKKPLISFIYTITDKNYTSMNEFMQLIEGYEIPLVLFSHTLFLSEELLKRHKSQFDRLLKTNSKEWEGYVIDMAKHIDINRLTECIREVKKKYYERLTFSPDLSEGELHAYYKDYSYSVDRMCYAPWLTAVISPEGNISPCSDYVIGNIRDRSFDEIWNGEKVKNFRRTLVKRQKFPVCDRCCMIHRHDLFH